MSRKENDGRNNTQGMGGADQEYVPDTRQADPGARNLSDPDWVRKDRIYKEWCTKRPKYY